MVYIEYISRRHGVDLARFQRVVGHVQSAWAAQHEDDVMVLNVGRTWRVGPEPEYMCVWHSPGKGPERLDQWERTFRSGEADAIEEPFHLAARIDRAGFYEPLLEPIIGSAGRYYVERFDLAPGAARHDAVAYFEARRAARPDLELNLLVDCVGGLAPAPRGMAVWGLPTWGHLGVVATDLDDTDSPVTLVTAGLYADLGDEQL